MSTVLASALARAGFAGTAEAGARTLLGGLSARGFGGQGATLGGRLQAAISQFQQASGLPVTGQLDTQTLNLLSQLGLIPREAPQQPGLGRSRDGFEGGVKVSKELAKATKDMTPKEQAQVQTAFSQVMNNLATAPRRALELVLQTLGLAAGPSPDDGGATPAKAEGQALADGAAAQGRADGTALKSGKGAVSKKSGTDQTRMKPGQKANQDRGKEGDDDEGRGHDGFASAGDVGGDEAGAKDDGAHDEGAADGDDDGTEHKQGSATSGTDDWRERARHAQMGDDDADVGHYEVPLVAEQLERSLTEIYVEVAPGQSKATTYSWDVELFRPGVYGPGQAAETIFKVRVERATAFDRVWARAAERLNTIQKNFDTARGEEVSEILPEDVLAAIRQARFR